MKNLTENIWLKLLAAFTAFIAAVRSFEYAADGLLVDGLSISSAGLSLIGSIAALIFSFTKRYRLIWLGFLLAALNLGYNVALYTAIAGVVLAALKDLEVQNKQARAKVTKATPLILAIMGAFLIVGPILVSVTLTPILCPSGANESNCSIAALPWFTYITAPLGIVLLVVSVVIKNTRSKKSQL